MFLSRRTAIGGAVEAATDRAASALDADDQDLIHDKDDPVGQLAPSVVVDDGSVKPRDADIEVHVDDGRSADVGDPGQDTSRGWIPSARTNQKPSPLKARSSATSKFELIPFQQLRPDAGSAYLIRGFIPRVGLTVVWGPPKCGKTFWTFDMAMHIALGWSYRGRRVHGGAVVYCAFEGAAGFKARAQAFRLRHLPEGDAVHPQLYLSPSPMDLVEDSPALIASIRAQVDADHPVVLVVLDTLNRSLRGSESDDRDMASYIRASDAIRDAFNCAVIIVHHCGIDTTRPRGHSALAGAVDAQLAVKRDAADNVVVTVERMKDGPEGDTITSALEVVEVGVDADGDDITSCVIVEAASSSSGGKARVSGAAKVALDLLRRAIAEDGIVPQNNKHIPPNTRTTTLVQWRSHCDSGMVATSDKPDSRRKAFVRACERLQTLGVIGIWEDYVWLTGQSGQ